MAREICMESETCILYSIIRVCLLCFVCLSICWCIAWFNFQSFPICRPRSDPARGMELLWHPDVVHVYLPLLSDCSNPETLEAAAGAIQNLAACEWQVSTVCKADTLADSIGEIIEERSSNYKLITKSLYYYQAGESLSDLTNSGPVLLENNWLNVLRTTDKQVCIQVNENDWTIFLIFSGNSDMYITCITGVLQMYYLCMNNMEYSQNTIHVWYK